MNNEILKHYRKYLSKQYGYLDFSSFSTTLSGSDNNIKRVLLKKIFLSIEFSKYKSRNTDTIDTSNILDDSTDKIILADPSHGKTTFLKFALLSKIEENIIPVYWEWDELYYKLNNNNNLTIALSNSLKKLLKNDHSEEEIESFIEDNKFVFLIDDFNDTLPKDYLSTIRTILINYRTEHPEDHFIISSRIANYSDESYTLFSEIKFQHYEISPLNEHLIFKYVHDFIEHQFPNDKLKSNVKIEELTRKIKEQPYIKTLAEHPYLLNLIVLIYTFETSLPDTKADLFKKCIENLVYGWEKPEEAIKTFNHLNLNNEDLASLFSEVAFECFQKFINGEIKKFGILPKDILEETLKEAYRRKRCDRTPEGDVNLAVRKLFKYFKEGKGLIVGKSPNEYGFTHSSILEYLAAKYIEREKRDFNGNLGYIINMLQDSRFENFVEMILFQVEILASSPSEQNFIDSLADKLLPLYKNEKNYNALLLLAKLLKDNQEFSILDTKEILKLLTIFRANNPENIEVNGIINEFLLSEKYRTRLYSILNNYTKEKEILEKFSQKTTLKLEEKIESIHDDLNIVKEEYGKIKNSVSSKELSEKILSIKDKLDSLNTLLSDCKNFTSEIETTYEEIDIDSIIQEILKKIENSFPDIKISYFPNEKTLKIFTDKKHMEKIIEELIKNSSKHSARRNGVISLSLEYQSNKFIIHFTDDGKGISVESKDKIFEPYYTTDSESTGIGLTLIKKLMNSLDGEIREVGEENKGSHFILSFDIARSY